MRTLFNSFLKKIRKNKTTVIFLAVLIIIGLYLRTHFGTRYYTLGDESLRDASVALIGSRELQLPLTGPFSSLGPFTFGPWYFYQLIFSYLFIPSFWAPWISLTIFSLLLIIVVYKIGVLVQDKYLGFIAAVLATFSIAQLDASRVLANPSPVGFLSALIILLAIQIYKGQRSAWRFLFWGFLTGVTITYHYQSLWLLTLLVFVFSSPKKYLKILPWYGLGLLAAALPTIFFELNNHWTTTRNILRYIQYDQYAIYIPNRWLTYLTNFVPDFLGSVLGTEKLLTILIMGLSLFIFLRDFFQKKLPKEILYLLISAIIIFISLRYWRGQRSFGYLQFFHAYIFIFTAYMARNLWPKYKNFPAIVICLVLIGSAIIWQGKHFSQDAKNQKATRMANILNEKLLAKYDWYTCETYSVELTQGISLIQDYKGMLDKNGKKLAFFSEECLLPIEIDTNKLKKDEIVNLTNKLYPKIQIESRDLFDLSNASESGLIKNGWYRVNPKILSDSMTKWWLNERQ